LQGWRRRTDRLRRRSAPRGTIVRRTLLAGP
jgi:hypothetical protein